METVDKQLEESAPGLARKALEALSTEDEGVFALYAATSLEHLLKAFLAGKHPALIVDMKSLDSLLHACGQDAAARTPRDQVRTISVTESLERAARFLPLLGQHSPLLNQLFSVRNGTVHLADRRSIQPFIFPFLSGSEILREALALDRETYWGEYRPLADASLREHVEAAELKASASLAAARANFTRRFGDLDQKTRDAIIAALEPAAFFGDEEQPITCPACESTALAAGTVETRWRYEQVGDEDFEPALDATFLPETLQCNVCGLRLENFDEFRAVMSEHQWDIDVDPSQYIEEPDEDYWR